MQHPVSDAISTNEEAFILRALEKGVRLDGRRLLEVRPVAIEFGAVAGTCEVRLGQTKLIATATAELIEPYPDRPAEGALQFFVEFSPMASPVFEPGRPSEPAVELMRLLERAIRKSQAIDLEALCVVPGKGVWSVRCDLTVTDHRGNLTDAAVVAALAALRHLRLPGTAVSGSGDDADVAVLPAEQAEPQPLVFHHMPIAATLAFFRGAPP
jgi:exosome complex component RRP45